ncbi:MAG TPA: mitochondrial fission ELM1 family protein [Saliniramus sp.]|nr:mitochondrial fission ELM1 family protein [Saliniramus sp.]
MSDPIVWAVTSGEAGMRAQALGLAEALGFPFEERRIALRRPWRWLPGHLCPLPLMGLDPAHDILAPPWPDILITCGRRSTAISIAIRKRSQGRTLTVHLQNPQTPLSAFDLVVAHPHDGVAGDNVLLVETTIHRVTPDKLAQARKDFANSFDAYPSPRLGVLLGGRTKKGGFGDADIAVLLAGLSGHLETGGSLLITPSRRTEERVVDALRQRLAGDRRVLLWDGAGENPYFGILALSDRLVVTADSTSMVSEALSTGSPVDLVPLEGLGRRHKLFLERLESLGHVARFGAGRSPQRPPPLPDAATLAAAQVKELLAARTITRTP